MAFYLAGWFVSGGVFLAAPLLHITFACNGFASAFKDATPVKVAVSGIVMENAADYEVLWLSRD